MVVCMIRIARWCDKYWSRQTLLVLLSIALSSRAGSPTPLPPPFIPTSLHERSNHSATHLGISNLPIYASCSHCECDTHFHTMSEFRGRVGYAPNTQIAATAAGRVELVSISLIQSCFASCTSPIRSGPWRPEPPPIGRPTSFSF